MGKREEGFYAELWPINDKAIRDALKVSGFVLSEQAKTGERLERVMMKFRDCVEKVKGLPKPVFVGSNAGFDWPFVNWHFHRYLGDNPFGFATLHIKSFYMGMASCDWEGSKSRRLCQELQPVKPGTHNALTDSIAQAEMFEKIPTARNWPLERMILVESIPESILKDVHASRARKLHGIARKTCK